jgi:hypothetical protein
MPHAPRLIAFDKTGSDFSESASRGISPSTFDSAGRVGAKMIPAAFHDEVSPTLPRKSIAAQRLQTSIRQIHKNNAAPPAVLPKLVRASAADSGQPGQAHSLWLVMRTAQVDDSGQMIWSVSVWHLSLFHPVDQEVHKGITPKST